MSLSRWSAMSVVVSRLLSPLGATGQECTFPATANPVSAATGEPVQVTDANAAELLGSHARVALTFTAPWAGPSFRFEPVVRSLASQYVGRVTFGLADAGASPILAGACDVRAVPSTILFESGQPAGVLVGAVDSATVAAWLDGALAAPEARPGLANGTGSDSSWQTVAGWGLATLVALALLLHAARGLYAFRRSLNALDQNVRLMKQLAHPNRVAQPARVDPPVRRGARVTGRTTKPFAAVRAANVAKPWERR